MSSKDSGKQYLTIGDVTLSVTPIDKSKVGSDLELQRFKVKCSNERPFITKKQKKRENKFNKYVTGIFPNENGTKSIHVFKLPKLTEEEENIFSFKTIEDIIYKAIHGYHIKKYHFAK